jgi:hypothetical protein
LIFHRAFGIALFRASPALGRGSSAGSLLYIAGAWFMGESFILVTLITNLTRWLPALVLGILVVL